MYTRPPDVIVVVDRELRIRYNYGLCLKKEDVKKKKKKKKKKKEKKKKEKKRVITAVYHAISA